jgi:hypothetical protein
MCHTDRPGNRWRGSFGDGQFLYAETGKDGIVEAFYINFGGSLTELGSVTMPNAVGSEGVAVSADQGHATWEPPMNRGDLDGAGRVAYTDLLQLHPLADEPISFSRRLPLTNVVDLRIQRAGAPK